jgi:hypothetical protein
VLGSRDHKSFFSRLGLCASREHSSGCVRCTRTGRSTIKDFDESATRRESPGNTETDDAGTNDGDLWFADAKLPSLE